MGLAGLESQPHQEDVVSNRSRRLSRGDRRRNERLAALRSVVTRQSAVLAFDLAADKQVCALTDPDSRVLARRTVRVKAWQLSEAVAWGLGKAAEAGFTSVVVACEPTGHRWRVLDQIAAELGVRLVCVQPLLVARAREAEDFTRNKNDDIDAVIIARLVTELRCYLPERATRPGRGCGTWGPAGPRLVTEVGAARQQIRDLLECCWPAALDAAGEPLDSKSWLAAVTVLLDRVGATGDLAVISRWGWDAFTAAVCAELPRHGATRRYRRSSPRCSPPRSTPRRPPSGSPSSGPGPWNESGSCWPTWPTLRAEIADVEARMVARARRAGAHRAGHQHPRGVRGRRRAILAETGDPARFASARALVKHAGLCPRDNASGTYNGKTTISGRGRPELRAAAWRAVFAALQHNPVMAARHAHLTGRAEQPLTDTQARIAIAAGLLRQLHAVIVTATPWNPAIAAGHRDQHGAAAAA